MRSEQVCENPPADTGVTARALPSSLAPSVRDTCVALLFYMEIKDSAPQACLCILLT